MPPVFATPESLSVGVFDIDVVRCAIEQPPVIFREVIFRCVTLKMRLTGRLRNFVDPDRNRHVTPDESPKDGSRRTPYHYRCTMIGRLVPSGSLASRNGTLPTLGRAGSHNQQCRRDREKQWPLVVTY